MFTIWFMGLPSSGKSTLAKKVENELVDRGFPVENLDGDNLRKNLHPDLGFSREDRGINNKRTAYIARLLNKNGIPTIVGMITPFRDAQQQAREIIESESQFILVYVKCSVEECKERDPKGLYQKAEEGKIENFTGINHPFQEPKNPEIIVDSENNSVDECVDHILERLSELEVLDQNLEEYNFDITTSEEESIKKELKDGGFLDG